MFCTARNFSPPWAMNAARARSFGVLSGVIVTAGAAEAGAAPFGDDVFAGSWANTSALNNTVRAIEAKTVFLISPAFQTSEIQSYLRVDAPITRTRARRTGTTKVAEIPAHRQRLAKVR